MPLTPAPLYCMQWGCQQIEAHKSYTLKVGAVRQLYYCPDCKSYFSETQTTPLAHLKTPLSQIVLILQALNEGLGVNAVCRLFHVGKNSLYRWQERLSDLKPTLLLYALCQQFLHLLIEGDELYLHQGKKNLAPEVCEGWTIVLMDRASRFLWELQCGRKDRKLFRRAIRALVRMVKTTQDLTLITGVAESGPTIRPLIPCQSAGGL